jgi:hypothetical protein
VIEVIDQAHRGIERIRDTPQLAHLFGWNIART